MELNQNKTPESGGAADQPKTNEDWRYLGRLEYREHQKQAFQNELKRWSVSSSAASEIVGDEIIKKVVMPMINEVAKMLFEQAEKESDRFFGIEPMSEIVIDGRGQGTMIKINKTVARAASDRIFVSNQPCSQNGGVK